MTVLIGDIEANGLRPNQIWMVGIIELDSGVFTPYVGDDVAEGIMRLAEAELFVGHHIEGYDVPVMERLTEGLVKFEKVRLIDTLPLARSLMPGLENYKLGSFGDMFGLPKLPFREFDRFTPEMIPYCQRDCEINLRLFQHLLTLC